MEKCIKEMDEARVKNAKEAFERLDELEYPKWERAEEEYEAEQEKRRKE